MNDRFERIREEIEARQRSILWPDYLYATRNTYDFLWNGVPGPKMVQRIGLAIFGMYFLAIGVSFISISSSSELGWFNPAIVFYALPVLFSLRVLRNAFVRSATPASHEKSDTDEDPAA